MKLILSCLLLVASFMIQAQENTNAVKGTSTYTITKTELSKVKLLNDLIPNLRENYSSLGYEITAKVGGKVLISVGSGNELREEQFSLFSSVQLHSKMFIDISTHVNDIAYKNAYSFYVTE